MIIILRLQKKTFLKQNQECRGSHTFPHKSSFKNQITIFSKCDLAQAQSNQTRVYFFTVLHHVSSIKQGCNIFLCYCSSLFERCHILVVLVHITGNLYHSMRYKQGMDKKMRSVCSISLLAEAAISSDFISAGTVLPQLRAHVGASCHFLITQLLYTKSPC